MVGMAALVALVLEVPILTKLLLLLPLLLLARAATPHIPPKLQLRLPSLLAQIVSLPPHTTWTRLLAVCALFGGTL
jgi:hypothetical protein